MEDYYYGSWENIDRAYHAEWTGTLIDALLPDGLIDIETSDYRGDYMGTDGAHTTIVLGECNVAWEIGDYYGGDDLDEILIIGPNEYLMDQSPQAGKYNGYINGECIGEIDPATWEILGACAE